jgi:hypothetical protein
MKTEILLPFSEENSHGCPLPSATLTQSDYSGPEKEAGQQGSCVGRQTVIGAKISLVQSEKQC